MITTLQKLTGLWMSIQSLVFDSLNSPFIKSLVVETDRYTLSRLNADGLRPEVANLLNFVIIFFLNRTFF